MVAGGEAGEAIPALSAALGARLRARGLSIATAESCTGGALAAALTAVAGSSDYFPGGVVSYGVAAKRALLGVPAAILDGEGAVSEACAVAMARGAWAALGADLAVATTGIAGPGGAEPGKPVGLVFVAVAGRAGAACRRHVFPGDRAAVIAAATHAALALVLARLDRPQADYPTARPPD
ncbi:MAG TPA: CinA family protein [Thermomicrobiales bacterium]|nr:CinA family protein [Thermomicrobiales bacterium]